MSKTPEPTPSAGAVRAAEVIQEHLPHHTQWSPLQQEAAAKIIDRETGVARLEAELVQIKAALADPVAVHVNMLHGTIAWTPEALRHVLGDTGAVSCLSCERREKMGITLLGAMWLDPACHTGCQSLAWKNQAMKLAEALKGLIKSNEDHNAAIMAVIGKPTGWHDGYLEPARAALAAWEEGK